MSRPSDLPWGAPSGRRSTADAAPSPSALLVALVTLALLTVPVTAAPRCPMLTDPRGDAGQVLDDPEGDLLAVNVTADTRTMRVRVKLAAVDDPATPVVGHLYNVYLDDSEGGIEITADLGGFAPSYRVRTGRAPRGTGAYPAGKVLGTISGTVDAARREVRMNVPLALVPWK